MPPELAEDGKVVGKSSLPKKKREDIREMFSAISGRYDLLNHVLSLNRDVMWRQLAVQWVPPSARLVLDLGAGTGDFGLTLLRHHPKARLVALDFSLPMLAVAEKKVQRAGKGWRFAPLAGDGLQTPFPTAAFDAVLCAFVVRNFENILAGLQEMARVLRAGGVAIVLEFCHQPFHLARLPVELFVQHVPPLLGRWLSSHDFAYSYLSQSVRHFVTLEELAKLLRSAGFSSVRWVNLTFGVVTAFRAVR